MGLKFRIRQFGGNYAESGKSRRRVGSLLLSFPTSSHLVEYAFSAAADIPIMTKNWRNEYLKLTKLVTDIKTC